MIEDIMERNGIQRKAWSLPLIALSLIGFMILSRGLVLSAGHLSIILVGMIAGYSIDRKLVLPLCFMVMALTLDCLLLPYCLKSMGQIAMGIALVRRGGVCF